MPFRGSRRRGTEVPPRAVIDPPAPSEPPSGPAVQPVSTTAPALESGIVSPASTIGGSAPLASEAVVGVIGNLAHELAELRRESADTREAVKAIIERLANHPPPAGGNGTPPGMPAAIQTDPRHPPVPVTPYGNPSPGAGGQPNQDDISPGMLQLLQMAREEFGTGGAARAGVSPIEQRLIESSLGILDAKLMTARSEAGLADLILKRAANRLADHATEGLAGSFD